MPTANSHLVVIGGTSGLGLEIAKAAHASAIKVTIAFTFGFTAAIRSRWV